MIATNTKIFSCVWANYFVRVRMSEKNFQSCMFIVFCFFCNLRYFFFVDQKIFIQNSPHVFVARIVKCHKFGNIFTMGFRNVRELLCDDNRRRSKMSRGISNTKNLRYSVPDNL